MISFEELQKAFEVNQKIDSISPTQIRSIMKNVDYGGNGKINYSEFLAATVSLRKVLTDEKLYALFKHFDTDNSEFITPENMREAFQQNGRLLSNKQTKQIMRDHDALGDGRLSFEEFKAIFFDSSDECSDMISGQVATSSTAPATPTMPTKQS